MPIDWSILREQQPVDIASNFATGYKIGSTMVDKFHERNALAALGQNPNDNAALSTLYQVNPSLAASLESHQQARQTFAEKQAGIARRTALGTQYAGGDTAGAERAAVSQGDFDVAGEFSKLDEAAQKRAADFWMKAGPAAYQLKQTKDPAARQALWAQQKQILLSEGADPAQLNQFDPTNDAMLDAAIGHAQKVGDLIGQGKIEWHQQGENPSFATDAMGNPVGTQNPAVLSQLPHVGSPEEAKKLPPGTQFVTPDGRVGTVPGGQSGGSSTGGFSMRNNPGSLRVPGSMEFQRFSSPQEGIQAQQALLGRYMGRGLRNVSAIVERYAPRRSRGGDNSDASVNNYIAYVSRRLGVNPQDALSPALLPRLSQAMREFETGQRAD